MKLLRISTRTAPSYIRHIQQLIKLNVEDITYPTGQCLDIHNYFINYFLEVTLINSETLTE